MKNRISKIDIDQFDLEKEREKISENPGLIPFPHHVGGALVKPEDQGKIKGRAMAAMSEQAERQLNQIYEQMQVLAKQALEIKARIEVSNRIYNSQIGFEPLIGKTYFLYGRDGEKDVLSLIAPEEWGRKIPYEKCIAKVKLLSDYTWEVHLLNSNSK